MGVRGLLSYLTERKDRCVEYVDLVEVARQQDGIELLVDFYSFEHMLQRNLWKSLSLLSGNPYVRILGGEYAVLDQYVTKLVKDLQSVGIHLVMFIDGAKGSSQIGTQQKFETWKTRHYNDVKKLRDIMDICQNKKMIEDLPEDVNVRPVLLEVQLLETLKECNSTVVQCCAGEADFVIAQNMVTRPKAYAVISNDSDFCIFRDCKFISNSLFDLQNDLQLGEPLLLPEKPIRLIAGIVSSERVVSMFGVSALWSVAETHDRVFKFKLPICGLL